MHTLAVICGHWLSQPGLNFGPLWILTPQTEYGLMTICSETEDIRHLAAII